MAGSNLTQYIQPTKKPHHRELSIDILRGFAVLLMILAHASYFFRKNSNPIINFTENLGNTLAFVTFLFVSGVVTFITYKEKKYDWPLARVKLFKRILILLLGYYLTAFISQLHVIDFFSSQWRDQIFEILVFKNIPGFTEFMIPFIAYSFIYLIFPKILEYLGKHFYVNIIISLFLYILGSLVYFIDIGSPFIYIKMIFVGQEGFYRFPLLQYFIVFSLGLNVGYIFTKDINILERRKIFFRNTFYILFILAFCYILKPYSRFTEWDDFQRWPPTIGFMLTGIVFSLISLFYLAKKTVLDNLPKFYRICIFIGQKAYMFFIVHIIILQIYDITIKYKSDSPVIVLILFILLLFLTTYIVKNISNINNKIFEVKKDVQFQIAGQKNNKEEKSSVYKLFTIFAVLVIAVISFKLLDFKKEKVEASYEKRIGQIQGEVMVKKEEILPIWWNYDYAYHSKVSVYNQGLFSTIYKNSSVKIIINHKDLVQHNKSMANGNDLRVVYLDNGVYTELPIRITELGQESTTVIFNLIKDIEPNQTDRNYYLYYGNKLAGNPKILSQDPGNPPELERVTISSEKKGAISIATNRYWVIKDQIDPTLSKLQLSMTINSNTDSNTTPKDYSYKVIGTNLQGRLSSTADPKTYQANVDVVSLQPGIYQIQAIAEYAGSEILSPKESFVVSYPLYIVWSMDWEGTDVSDSYLNSIQRIATQYDIPISHFFNPRTCIALSQSRVKYLTDWLKNGVSQRGDSIDMHLHMYYDMAEAAGVDPYNTGGVDYQGNPISEGTRPRWGTPDQGGYDVLMTSYNYDDLIKVINWGLDKFQEYGLGTPKGFRAGGWFTDLENLTAEDDTGFLYDASGRSYYIWGSKKVVGPWNLSSTTQPYRPSRSDQNSVNPSPNFGLWEFPNNGADSYSFSSDEMIQRFNDNYQAGYLTEKRLVTYLSHPHWFNVDEPKLDVLFTYISQFLYKNDNGPVIFINMNEAYDSWT